MAMPECKHHIPLDSVCNQCMAMVAVAETLWQTVDRMLVTAYQAGSDGLGLDMLDAQRRFKLAASDAAMSAEVRHG